MRKEQISWWRTYLGEEEAQASAAAIRDGHLSRGPLTAFLESELAEQLGVPHAVLVPSGSMGLLLALMALDVGPGDEVIVPDLTWIATAHAASVLGAKVVLVDCEAERPLLDVKAVEAAITPRTKAILPVHLAGRAVPLDELRALAKSRGIAIVEDAAQAFASRTPEGPLGTLGDIGIFSLGVAKLVSTGQGGIVVTKDDELAQRLRDASWHGVRNGDEEAYVRLGMNMKFSDVLAAVGRQQLRRLGAKTAHVRAVYERYRDGLADVPGIEVEPIDLASGELPLWTEVRCDDRDGVREALAAVGIETHLPHRPLHHAPHLKDGAADAAFPNAERHARELLILPSGPAQSITNVDRVINALTKRALAVA